MKIKHTLLLLLIPLISTACFVGNETKLSDKIESPIGYHREATIKSRTPFRDGVLEFYRFERNRVSNYCSIIVNNKRKPEEDGLYVDQNCDGQVDVYVSGQNGQPKLRDETFGNNQDVIYKAKLRIFGE